MADRIDEEFERWTLSEIARGKIGCPPHETFRAGFELAMELAASLDVKTTHVPLHIETFATTVDEYRKAIRGILQTSKE